MTLQIQEAEKRTDPFDAIVSMIDDVLPYRESHNKREKFKEMATIHASIYYEYLRQEPGSESQKTETINATRSFNFLKGMAFMLRVLDEESGDKLEAVIDEIKRHQRFI